MWSAVNSLIRKDRAKKKKETVLDHKEMEFVEHLLRVGIVENKDIQ